MKTLGIPLEEASQMENGKRKEPRQDRDTADRHVVFIKGRGSLLRIVKAHGKKKRTKINL